MIKKKVIAWNTEASKIALDTRNRCPYCERGFASQNIVKHLHVCPKRPPNAEDITADKKPTTSSAPTYLFCGICGREFGTNSLKKHLPICLQKFHNEQMSYPVQVRRSEPSLSELLAVVDAIWADGKVTKAEITSQQKSAREIYNDSLARCPNCRRTFESTSLSKHLAGCRPTVPRTRAFGDTAEIVVTAAEIFGDEPTPEEESEVVYVPWFTKVADIKVLAE